MENAHEIIETVMKGVDFEENKKVWSFLNYILMGTMPGIQLDFIQVNHLVATLQEVACGNHNEALEDNQRSQQWAMVIATWVNSIPAAGHFNNGSEMSNNQSQ